MKKNAFNGYLTVIMVITVLALASCGNPATGDTGSTGNTTSAEVLPAPANLKAITSTNSSGNAIVTLTWTPVTGASYYVIYRSTDSTWTNYNIVSTTWSTTVYSYPYYSNDLPLKNNTIYYYKVGAKGVYTNGPVGKLSEAIEVYIGLSGIVSISATALSDSGIKVTWNVVEGAAKYRVYRGTNSSSTSMEPAAYVNAPATEYADTPLLPGTTYYYRIAVIDSEDREGAQSGSYGYATTRSTPTVTPFPAPENLTATVHGRVITLEWDTVASASTYYIYGAFAETGPYALIYNLNANYGPVYNVTSLTYYGFGIGLDASTTYYFKVSTSANGPMSDPVSATTGP